MKKTFSWLHISDLHIVPPEKYGRVGRKFDQKVVLDQFVEFMHHHVDQSDLVPGLSRPQYVFVTGDLAYTGKEDEYVGSEGPAKVSVAGHLKRTMDALGIPQEEHSKRLHITPGNHDVDRDYFSRFSDLSDEQRYLADVVFSEKTTDLLIGEGPKADVRKRILGRLSHYVSFAEQIKGWSGRKVEEILWYLERIPGTERTCSVEVMGLCSSWLS